MTPEEVASYRAAVEALVAECLALIRDYPVERDADPVSERGQR